MAVYALHRGVRGVQTVHSSGSWIRPKGHRSRMGRPACRNPSRFSGDRLTPSVDGRPPRCELRLIRPTVTPFLTPSPKQRPTVVRRRKLSIHLSIYCAPLHDVQRDQTRRQPKMSSSDAIQGDSLRPSRPHS